MFPYSDFYCNPEGVRPNIFYSLTSPLLSPTLSAVTADPSDTWTESFVPVKSGPMRENRAEQSLPKTRKKSPSFNILIAEKFRNRLTRNFGPVPDFIIAQEESFFSDPGSGWSATFLRKCIRHPSQRTRRIRQGAGLSFRATVGGPNIQFHNLTISFLQCWA